MTTYTATSHKFSGHISLTFDDEGNLRCLDLTQAEISHEGRQWLWSNPPLHIGKLERYAQVTKFIISEQLQEVTFEQFYDAYGYKEGRKKAENAWKRLSKAEQVKAYNYIPRLKTKTMNASIAMPYPATYLNQQRWND
jgi:hypothetical protein